MRCGLLRWMITSVCQSACFMRLRCANANERIEVLLGVEILAYPKNIVLDGSSITQRDSMRPSPNYFGYLFVIQLTALTASPFCDRPFRRLEALRN